MNHSFKEKALFLTLFCRDPNDILQSNLKLTEEFKIKSKDNSLPFLKGERVGEKVGVI